VRIIGPLPAPLGNSTTYCAAVMAPCAAPDAARAFIKALSAPQTRETWKAAGFDVSN
jgi:ABC-type molybdate transport system substrate-binding protein